MTVERETEEVDVKIKFSDHAAKPCTLPAGPWRKLISGASLFRGPVILLGCPDLEKWKHIVGSSLLASSNHVVPIHSIVSDLFFVFPTKFREYCR